MNLCKSCQIFPAVINGYCKDCLPQKSKKTNKIKPVSTKKAKLDTEYSKLRDKFLEDNPVCQGNFEGCTIRSTDVHHSMGRLKYYLDVETYVALCRNCHTHVETHPEEAKQMNLSKSRHNNLRTDTKGDEE